ncbi:AI-2E family transporter [Neolewinella lacunae]|uniref:AI-2E family transporter n=1 Tax=Neolewinella lacunae TaxID=1517758 RepID=A0A923PHV6_9BACT|nr:AI-2E family transporter [Neolewinella lacunae]MBC6992991.1 AI-2E family transporter [Neolewinella lacunae]MDN3635781.1 AI-2E family transporter [Neolewinella lacunae]
MPTDTNRTDLMRIQSNLFFILVAGTTLLFLGMIGPFLLTVLWAVVLTIIFYGVYRWIAMRFKGRRPGLAAALTSLLLFLFVIVPFALIGIALVQQGIGVFEKVQSGEIDPSAVVSYADENLPRLTESLDKVGVSMDDLRERVSGFAVEASQFVATRVLTFSGSVLNTFVQFTLMLYLLFFFLKDGKTIMRKITNTIPMGNVRERTLFTRFATVSRATLKGTLVVALVQGTIGGLTFAILGIPAALLWGVAMTLLALLPVGGSGIVWVPTCIILFAQGEVGKGIALLIVGSLIIGLADNLLRPLLVGRDTQMPDFLVLISTLGGITYFGLSGFVIGPTIAALFITVWEMMGRDYGGKID